MPHTMRTVGRTVIELEKVKLAQRPEDLYVVLPVIQQGLELRMLVPARSRTGGVKRHLGRTHLVQQPTQRWATCATATYP